MKTLKTIMLASVVILPIAGPAGAQGAGMGPAARQCAQDVKKFCADKQHGGGDIRTCLESKKAGFSAACKEVLEMIGPGEGQKK